MGVPLLALAPQGAKVRINVVSFAGTMGWMDTAGDGKEGIRNGRNRVEKREQCVGNTVPVVYPIPTNER